MLVFKSSRFQTIPGNFKISVGQLADTIRDLSAEENIGLHHSFIFHYRRLWLLSRFLVFVDREIARLQAFPPRRGSVFICVFRMRTIGL